MLRGPNQAAVRHCTLGASPLPSRALGASPGLREFSPSGFMVSENLPELESTERTRTSMSWPTSSRSAGLLTKPVDMLEMCRRPSLAAPMSMNAPYSARLRCGGSGGCLFAGIGQ